MSTKHIRVVDPVDQTRTTITLAHDVALLGRQADGTSVNLFFSKEGLKALAEAIREITA